MAKVTLEYLRVFISWPFLVFVLLLVARKEVTRVLEELAKRLKRAEVAGQTFEFQQELKRVEERVTQKVDESKQAVQREMRAAQSELNQRIDNLQGFFFALDSVIEKEERLQEAYKSWRDEVFHDYRTRLDNMPIASRVFEQEWWTRNYLKRLGITLPQLKQALKSVGAYDGEIDESFDATVCEAIVEFQAQHGLEPDGIFGMLTYKKLATLLKPSTSGAEND